MFLFLLELVPAGPCGCASGNHEVKTITDITLAFHHVHTEDLLSFAGPANTPTKNSCSSQIIWVGRFWFQDNCIFPAAPHSHRRDHIEPPPVLWSDRVPLLTCWTPSLRAGFYWKLMSRNLVSYSCSFRQLIPPGISVPLRMQGSETQPTWSGEIVLFPWV